MVIWILLSFLPFAILFLIWQELYAGQTVVNTYTLPEIVGYYLISIIITNLTDVHFENWRSEEIRMGRIDFFLLRPYHYLTDIFLGETVGKLLYTALFLIPYLGFIAWSLEFTQFSLPLPSLQSLGVAVFLLICAYLIQCLVGMLITLLTFWFEGAQGLEQFKWLIIALLSGSLMPLEFLPNWLRGITEMLPLQYLYAVPINVLLGRDQLQLFDVAYLACTLGALALLVHLVWHRGIAKYASVGG